MMKKNHSQNSKYERWTTLWSDNWSIASHDKAEDINHPVQIWWGHSKRSSSSVHGTPCENPWSWPKVLLRVPQFCFMALPLTLHSTSHNPISNLESDMQSVALDQSEPQPGPLGFIFLLFPIASSLTPEVIDLKYSWTHLFIFWERVPFFCYIVIGDWLCFFRW